MPGGQSPLSVPEGDPAVAAEDVTFASQGIEPLREARHAWEDTLAWFAEYV